MKNILFDLDGTLTDPQDGILNCIEYALNKLGAPVPERNSLKKYIGPSLWESFMELLSTDSRERADEGVTAYRERFSTVGKFENTPYEGVHSMLGSLQSSGYSLYICTSKPAVFAKQIAEHFEFAEYFTEIHGSRLDGSLVDKTELIAHIISTENLKKEKTIMIGDRKYDIEGAVNNGVTAYGVSYGFGSPDEFLKALQVFHSPADIGDYFKR